MVLKCAQLLHKLGDGTRSTERMKHCTDWAVFPSQTPLRFVRKRLQIFWPFHLLWLVHAQNVRSESACLCAVDEWLTPTDRQAADPKEVFDTHTAPFQVCFLSRIIFILNLQRSPFTPCLADGQSWAVRELQAACAGMRAACGPCSPASVHTSTEGWKEKLLPSVSYSEGCAVSCRTPPCAPAPYFHSHVLLKEVKLPCNVGRISNVKPTLSPVLCTRLSLPSASCGQPAASPASGSSPCSQCQLLLPHAPHSDVYVVLVWEGSPGTSELLAFLITIVLFRCAVQWYVQVNELPGSLRNWGSIFAKSKCSKPHVLVD